MFSETVHSDAGSEALHGWMLPLVCGGEGWIAEVISDYMSLHEGNSEFCPYDDIDDPNEL